MFGFLGSSPVRRRLQFFEVILLTLKSQRAHGFHPRAYITGTELKMHQNAVFRICNFKIFRGMTPPDRPCGRGDPLTHPPSARRGPVPPLLWPTRHTSPRGLYPPCLLSFWDLPPPLCDISTYLSKIFRGHVTLNAHHLGTLTFVITALFTFNLQTKFEISSFIRFRDMACIPKCRNEPREPDHTHLGNSQPPQG